MHDRYADIEKFITDPDKLQITNGSEVYISSEDNHDIVVDLQGHTEDFEQLKPFISFASDPGYFRHKCCRSLLFPEPASHTRFPSWNDGYDCAS